MLVHTSSLNQIFKEANDLLDKNTQNIQKIDTQETKQEPQIYPKERVTYGLVSLEIMSDMQYQAFERITTNMSPNEKIAIAQILTRVGNLSASVEQIKEQEQANPTKSTQGFLGITQEGWQVVAKEFQENLNHLDGIYTKSYNKSPTSNYNDILRKNSEAKTQRILREFSHAIHSGNAQIDTIG